jgi:uncharacterized protein (TIGR02246 family)
MTITLTPLVAALLAAHNAHDAEAFVACFTDDATLRDEGRAHHGPVAIRAWFESVCRRYRPELDVTGVADVAGETILSVTVSGAFEGGPLALRYILATEDEKFVALRIVP